MVAQSTTQQKKKAISPITAIALIFVFLIVVGTIILSLPVSWANGHARPFAALFTATSAVCVTGLVVVDTGTAFSKFGQSIILILIQLGGLAYMAAATAAAVVFGRRLGLSDRIMLKETSGQSRMTGIIKLAKSIFLYTVIAELIGAIILTFHFMCDPKLHGADAVYSGLFHSISAFCNSGIDVMGPVFGKFSNLMHYRSDWLVSLTVAGLIILGGLGYPAVDELLHSRRHRLSIHTKLVVGTTLALLLLGTVAILGLEWSNPHTLGGLPVQNKVLASFFQSTSARTTGYHTLDIGNMSPASQVILGILMFIGASPAGVGGGIKTTTFVLIVLAVISVLRGKSDTEVFGRRIPMQTVLRAFALTLLAAALAVIAMLVISYSELRHGQHAGFLAVQFEVLSAWGTAGLSTGLTPKLHAVGRVVLILMMYIGRIGPLAAFIAFAEREKPVTRRLAEENVVIG